MSSLLSELLDRYPRLAQCEADLRCAADALQRCYSGGGTLYACGNGGSAADSEHVVGELMKSFKLDRPVDPCFKEEYRQVVGEEPPDYLEGAIPAVSLVSQSALMTAFSNDEDPEGAFAQQVYGYGRRGDVLVAISTSGSSANVVAAAKVALVKGMTVVALTGEGESDLSSLADVAIRVPESETFKVQELHLPVYHYLCAELERRVFGDGARSSFRGREAVVLAGGFGTRLADAVPGVPKPMAPVAGRPFLRFVLDMLAENGFSRVVIADGYLREQVEGFFGGAYRGMSVDYSPEEEPLGTGGAAKRALGKCRSDFVFVLNGDTFFEADFGALERGLAKGAAAVMAVKRMRDFDRYGAVEVCPGGEVLAFREKESRGEGLVNGGVYCMRRDALEGCPERFSLEAEWLEDVAAEGRLYAVECEGDFVDIGIPEDYERSQELLASRSRRWRLALFDRDGTIIEDPGHLHDPGQVALLDDGVELVRRYSEEDGWKVVVATNQAGIAKGLYGEPEMRAVNARLQELLAERGAHVDAFYFCPHHPDYTGVCGCRKPAPGMLLAAVRDFDADPSECVMYGDKQSDMEAAEAAGVRGVLI